MSLILMRGQALTTGTTSSLALMLVDDELEIDFDLNCSGGPSIVTYYIEYSEDLVVWFREVAEENAGKGVVLMPAALRTLADSGSAVIANNTSFRASCQFTRQAQFARIQMSAATGTVSVNSVVAEKGIGPYGANVVVPAAGGGCTPGQTLYDTTTAGPQQISTDFATFPPHNADVFVINGLGSFADCSNFRISVTLDYQELIGGGAFRAYLNDTGLTVSDRSFSNSGSLSAILEPTSIDTDHAYHTETLAGQDSGFVNPYADFAGPLGPQSLYFWVPTLPPAFSEGSYNIKNIIVVITTI
jgi:hypothetical protein